MRSISYGAFDDLVNGGINHCNRASDSLPLLINCTGSFSTESAFTTDNRSGRADYYLLYVVGGALRVKLPDGYAVCDKGTFLFFPPGTPYAYSHSGNGTLEYLWVHFTGSDAERILRDYGFSLYPEVNRIKTSENVGARFNNIFSAFAGQDRFRDRELSLLLERLFISLARRLCDGADKDNQLRRSIAYINAKYAGEIRIPELADIESLSVSRYNALFRKIMGIAPSEYITRLRLSTAKELLANTDLSVAKVSRLVGYADPHFFSRIFRANTGLSPSEFRRNC